MPTLTYAEFREVVARVFSSLGESLLEVDRLQDHRVGNNLISYDSHGVRVIPAQSGGILR